MKASDLARIAREDHEMREHFRHKKARLRNDYRKKSRRGRKPSPASASGRPMNAVDFLRVFFNRGSKVVRERFGPTAYIDASGEQIAIRDEDGLLGRGATLNEAMQRATETMEVRAMRTPPKVHHYANAGA